MAKLDLDGRVALVTGAAAGLGAAYAAQLDELGARTVLVDRDEAVHRVAGSSASGSVALVGDVTDPSVADAAVTLAIDTFGSLHGLVCNAGRGAAAGPVHRFDDDVFDEVLRTHLHHSAIWCRAAWPLLRDVGDGAIVTTSSATAMGLAGTSDYAAGKGAIWSLTRSMALDGVRHGIRVNAVMPMAFTPMAATYPDETVRDWMRASFDPAEVAPAVCWLLHPACPTTGECFSVGGGRVARVVMSVAPGLESAGPLTFDDVAAGWDRALSLDGAVVADSSNTDAMMMRRALGTLG